MWLTRPGIRRRLSALVLFLVAALVVRMSLGEDLRWEAVVVFLAVFAGPFLLAGAVAGWRAGSRP